MNNNFKNKKGSLIQKVDFGSELNTPFEVKEPAHVSTQNIIPNNMSKDKKLYICINNHYDVGFTTGTIEEIETWIVDNEYEEDEIEIYELKSDKPVNFTFDKKVTIKIKAS
jgi:hypothetical protein